MTDIKDVSNKTPNPETVRMLKKLLEMAEQGEIRTLFYVTNLNDDSVCSNWSRDQRTSANRFIGGLVRAVMDFITAVNLSDEDSASNRAAHMITEEHF